MPGPNLDIFLRLLGRALGAGLQCSHHMRLFFLGLWGTFYRRPPREAAVLQPFQFA